MRPIAANADLRPFQRSARSASLVAARISNAPHSRADPLDLGRVVLDLLDHAVELDEEDSARAGGVAGRDGALGGLDREPVHHLDRGRHDAGRDDPETAAPAASIVWKPASSVRTACGVRTMPERDARRDPERALRADDHAEEVGPVRVERLAAELDDLAVGQDERQAGDVMRREAVLQAVRAARVLGDVAADRADLLARRVGRVEEAVGGDGARDVEVRDARLDDDALAREVDLEDPVHARERDDDASGDRRRAAREPGARAARDERHALAVAGAEHGLHVLGRAGEDDELGNRAVPGQPVALVDAELLRLGDDVLGAERACSSSTSEAGRLTLASLELRVGASARLEAVDERAATLAVRDPDHEVREGLDERRRVGPAGIDRLEAEIRDELGNVRPSRPRRRRSRRASRESSAACRA